MTSTTQMPPTRMMETTPALHYFVAMPHPETHLFEVTLQVTGWTQPILDLKMPVWTPGSYLVREYSKHLQNFTAETTNETPLEAQKIRKNHWQIQTRGTSELTIKYRIYANELTVRTNHLDHTHGYFNGAALFFYIPGLEKQPIRVTIQPPQNWQVTTALAPISGEQNTFIFPDFDTLVDTPFEIGTHRCYSFEVLGKPHELAIWGQGNDNPEKIIEDTAKIIRVEAEMFGGLPYESYLFLLHLSASGFGGLEHKDSCTLNYNRFGFRVKDKYERFIQLVAHEFFHLWNVKRIRPKALEIFDYENENYTTSLWFSEGTTSFYDLIIPFRAGIYDAKTYLDNLSKEITRLQTTPGRNVQPASESSFDAWIKLYRPDANTNNSQISYYLKGEMVSLLLDLLIRNLHNNSRSLDDVMRLMWENFGKAEIGFTPAQLKETIESVAGIDLSDFFKRYVDGTEELPFDEYLQPFGLKLISGENNGLVPFIGLTVKAENGKEIIKFVEVNSPAQKASINPGDELLAINQIRVTAETLNERLKDYQPGDSIEVTVFHQDELRTVPVILESGRPARFTVVPVENRTPEQETKFAGWLGIPLSKV